MKEKEIRCTLEELKELTENLEEGQILEVTFDGNKELDVVQVKLVMDKTLYSEEQLSSPDQVVQFMRKELSEYDREVFFILNCTTKSQENYF